MKWKMDMYYPSLWDFPLKLPLYRPPTETLLIKAISRLILAGTLDKFPDLRILLAHSGGTIPFLAGRLDSCVAHDPAVRDRLKHEPSWYLKRLYYDGVGYHAPALKLARELVGADRIMFG